MSADKTEEQGHGRFPTWLIVLWAAFLIFIVVYLLTGLGSSPR